MRRSSLFVALLLAASCRCGAAPDPAESAGQEVVLVSPETAPASGTRAPAPAPAAANPPADPALIATTPDERSPDEYRVVLDTTKGAIEIAVHRAWSPLGADRFFTMVKRGYFQDVAFFRVVPGFMAQFGMHGNPQVNAAWADRTIADEPVAQGNLRGRITFAKRGMPNSRSNQLFINFGDNSNLDGMGFAAFGEVRSMDVVDRLHSGYGESQPSGRGPRQEVFADQGNTYLRAQFPQLDFIRSARLVTE